MSNEVERAREEAMAALNEWWGAYTATPPKRVIDAARRLYEAERPQPRYQTNTAWCLDGVCGILDGTKPLTIYEVLARLNAAAEK